MCLGVEREMRKRIGLGREWNGNLAVDSTGGDVRSPIGVGVGQTTNCFSLTMWNLLFAFHALCMYNMPFGLLYHG